MTDKAHILREIKRLASENGGRPPGSGTFERYIGIKKSEWFPHLWVRWGDALSEAGFKPNTLQEKLSDETVLQKYAEYSHELGRFPVSGELKRKSKEDKTFPTHMVFSRFGGKDKLIETLSQFCENKPKLEKVSELCRSHLSASKDKISNPSKDKFSVGYVYLMKSGRHFKIGKTKSLIRRGGELRVQIPVPPTTVHSIETDDPSGVEAYWHRRFADKRGEGEWFELSPEDVSAFKRWKRLV